MLRELIKLLTSLPPDQTVLSTERQSKRHNASAVETKVKEIVAEVVEIEIGQVTSDALIYRIGSSNDALEVIMQCEEDFGIEIPDGEAEQCETVAKLGAYIQKRLGIAKD